MFRRGREPMHSRLNYRRRILSWILRHGMEVCIWAAPALGTFPYIPPLGQGNESDPRPTDHPAGLVVRAAIIEAPARLSRTEQRQWVALVRRLG
jgi:hypothetical protein